ncbi:MAG: prepilin-type N-terminal cleavage/methylation domain-containing protein [bacterium]
MFHREIVEDVVKKTPLRRCRAFSLLELMAVMAVAAVLLSLAAPLVLPKQTTLRQEAERFASALKTARQYAVTHGARTRLVFADEELSAATDGKLKPFQAYGLYAFYIPQKPDAPDASAASGGLWFITPPEFVGQWTPLPACRDWRRLPEGMTLECPMFQQARDEAGLRKLFFNPSNVWTEAVGDFLSSAHGASVFPLNYWQTPYPLAFSLTTSSRPPSDAPAAWPSDFPYTYFEVGSSKVGQAEDAVNGGSGRKFFNLCGVEFDPDGQPVFAENAPLVFRFSAVPSSDCCFEVSLDKTTGAVSLKKSE